MTIEAKAQSIEFKNTLFLENYSGQGSSCLDFHQVPQSEVILSNLTFFNNTGSFSFLEEEKGLPFYQLLTMRKYKLNFISHVGNCTNEINYIGEESCIFNKYDTYSKYSESIQRNRLY